MKNITKQILTHPLFTGSAIMMVGSTAVNVINYLYHLLMGRLLGPLNYGELAALISLISLIGIIPLSLGLVITKFIASAENEYQIKSFVNWFSRKVTIVGITLFVIISILSPIISSFLNIKNPLLVVLAGATFVFTL